MKKIRIRVLLLAAVLLFGLFSVGAGEVPEKKEPAARIYYINVSTSTLTGDCILVESQGRYGLIDAGHRRQTSIEDEAGNVYACTYREGLSCQSDGKYGEAIAAYLVRSLGVHHLDFVLATHSHSDHIGGLPEIANYRFVGENGYQYLVDETTVYFYKPYYHVNDADDDLALLTQETESEEAVPEEEEEAVRDENSIFVIEKDAVQTAFWHTQAFYYQAKKAMEEHGCILCDVSGGAERGQAAGAAARTAAVKRLADESALADVCWEPGDEEDLYDDYIAFSMGAVELRLYNLPARITAKNENINSIVAVLDDGTNTAAFLGDLNVEQQTEQKIAAAIREDVGTIDLLKAAHHGNRNYSNSRGMLDALQPRLCVVTGNQNPKGQPVLGAFTCARFYAAKKYGTQFYEAGASRRAILAELSEDGVQLFAVYGGVNDMRRDDPVSCLYEGLPPDGWSWWQSDYPDKYVPYAGDWMLFREGEALTGWIMENDVLYHFDEDGLLQTGLQEINGKNYYLWTAFDSALVYGEVVAGWMDLADGRYYFFADGTKAEGWQEIDGKTYYFRENGPACTGWIEIGGRWYCFDASGAMQTGWQELALPGGSRRCYFDEDGAMHTGWLTLEDGERYLDEDGQPLTGWQRLERDGAQHLFRFDEDGLLIYILG